MIWMITAFFRIILYLERLNTVCDLDASFAFLVNQNTFNFDLCTSDLVFTTQYGQIIKQLGILITAQQVDYFSFVDKIVSALL